MKILQISDLHLFSNKYGITRHKEEDKVMEQIISASEKADIVVLNGDLTDSPYSPSGELLNTIYKFLNTLLDNGLKVYYLMGNHDWKGLFSLDKLKTLKGLYVIDDKKIITFKNERLIFQSYLNVDKEFGGKNINEKGQEYFKEIWPKTLDDSRTNIFITHNSFKGSFYTPEDYDKEYIIQPEDINEHIDVILAGHIHEKIDIEFGPTRLIYPSSPMTMSFGEEDSGNSIVIYDTKTKKAKFIDIKCKRFKTLKLNYDKKTESADIKEKIINFIKDNPECYYKIKITGKNFPSLLKTTIRNISENILKIQTINTKKEKERALNKNNLNLDIKDTFHKFTNDEEIKDCFDMYYQDVISEKK